MAYDVQRDVVVLFGGQTWTSGPPNYSSQYSNETWEWNGVEWSLRSTAGPPPTANVHMVYDSRRNVTVLYRANYVFGTWEWDGISWNWLSDGPGGSYYGEAMAYDESRGVSLLFGGFNPSLDYCDQGMYQGYSEWNGISWAGRIFPETLYRVGHSAVYDAQNQMVIAFGGWKTCRGSAPSAIWNLDCNGACEPPQPPTAEQCASCAPGTYAPKNRYLSFEAPAPSYYSATVALRVTLSQLPGPSDCPEIGDFSARVGQKMWVGDEVQLGGGALTGVFRLQSQPLFRDWSDVPGGVIQLSDCNIIPCAVYAIEAVSDAACDLSDPNAASAILLLNTTTTWADVVGTGNNQLPNGIVDFTDISACVDRFKNSPTAPPRTWCDLGNDNPTQGVNLNIDFGDISLVVDAFRGRSYPFLGPTAPEPCP